MKTVKHHFWLDSLPTQGRKLLKTMWDKKKMLETNIFFFYHNVFYTFGDKHGDKSFDLKLNPQGHFIIPESSLIAQSVALWT